MIKLLLALLLFTGSLARAQGLTLLAGPCQSTPQSNGVWYQKGFPYELNMATPCLGLRYDSARFGPWSYSLGYLNFGRISSSAEATASDDNYNTATQACNGECWPMSHWFGNGGTQGLYASVVRHYGSWAIEAGLMLQRPTWEMRIPDWIQCQTCAPIDLTVTHNPRLQLNPVLGLRYTLKEWSFNLMTVRTASRGDEWSSLYTQTYAALVGYTF